MKTVFVYVCVNLSFAGVLLFGPAAHVLVKVEPVSKQGLLLRLMNDLFSETL